MKVKEETKTTLTLQERQILTKRSQQWQHDRSFTTTLKLGKEKGFTDMDDYVSRSIAYKQEVMSKRKEKSTVNERQSRFLTLAGSMRRLMPAIYIIVGLTFMLVGLRKGWFFPGDDKNMSIFGGEIPTVSSDTTMLKSSDPMAMVQATQPPTIRQTIERNKDNYIDYSAGIDIPLIQNNDATIHPTSPGAIISKFVNGLTAALVIFLILRFVKRKAKLKPPPQEVFVVNEGID